MATVSLVRVYMENRQVTRRDVESNVKHELRISSWWVHIRKIPDLVLRVNRVGSGGTVEPVRDNLERVQTGKARTEACLEKA